MMPRAKVSVWASGMGTLFHRVHLFISHRLMFVSPHATFDL